MLAFTVSDERRIKGTHSRGCILRGLSHDDPAGKEAAQPTLDGRGGPANFYGVSKDPWQV